MSRNTWVATVLAGLATAAAVAPVSTLVDPGAWSKNAALILVAVMATGAVLRLVTRSLLLIVAYQLLVAFEVLLQVSVPHTLLWGFPTTASMRAINDLLLEAIASLTKYAAPVPGSPGLAYAMGALVALLATAVDAVAVTARRPAPAGLLLLAAYLSASSNAGAGFSVWWFVLAAAAWLALVGHAGLSEVTHWGQQPQGSGRRSSRESIAVTGRRITAVALAVTAVGAFVLPHLPTRFLADGLGRAPDSVGGSTGRGISLSTSADLATSLGNRSDEPVFEYRMPAGGPVPAVFRVEVFDLYDGFAWTASTHSTTAAGANGLEVLADANVPRTERRVAVSANALGDPQVALPLNTVGNPFPTIGWGVSGLGTVRIDAAAPEYEATYLDLAPTDADLTGEVGDVRPTGASVFSTDLEPLGSLLDGILDRITDVNDSPIDKARAIQAYLRGPEFSYSLTLDDSDVGTDPVRHFLDTKKGYCVQFAATMILLAERAGIPARMGTGFLPGHRAGNGYVVLASDAHAWPELFFPSVGWVRFEPTPGGRSGVAPAYTTTRTQPSAAPSASGSAQPTRGPSQRPDVEQGIGTTAGTQSGQLAAPIRWARDHAVALLAALVALLALAFTPLSAWWSRRRRHRRAVNEAQRMEALWTDLIYRLRDLDLDPPGEGTPRQVGRYIATHATLGAPEVEALGNTVLAVERSRYAAHTSSTHADVGYEVDTVVQAVASQTPRWTRVRARLRPLEGIDTWRRRSPREDQSR